jgi:hypothetical protein
MHRVLQVYSLIASFCCIFAAPARATLFIYEQTSASVPGLSITASMSINGGVSDLPTLNQSSVPIDFGNLLAFELLAPNGMTYTLADFVAPFNLDAQFPQWRISPGEIFFIDANDSSDFHVLFGPGTIQFDTDRPSVPPDCSQTGACVSTGHWTAAAIPEPSGPALVLFGLFALFLVVGHSPLQTTARIFTWPDLSLRHGSEVAE